MLDLPASAAAVPVRASPAPEPAAVPAAPVPQPRCAQPGAAGRDPRLDVFRGLALVMIYINHIPGTIYETFTSRNFGFSDAAEGFFFMSGTAAALAYAGPLALWQAGQAGLWPALARVWGRAWTLYGTHLLLTVVALGIMAAGALYWGDPELFRANNGLVLFTEPLASLTGLPLLTHQIGYVNILPVYAVLLLATPGLLLLGLWRPGALVAGALLLWAMAGQFRLNLPSYPMPGGWFFNPLSWQAIFALGLATGLCLRAGRRLVPQSRPLLLLCACYLVLALVWRLWPPLTAAGNAAMGQLAAWGLPFYIRDFDKTFLALPRLLHILALAYVLSALPQVRQLAASRLSAPLALLGRHGLPVFALGTVLAIAGQAVKQGAGPGMPGDTLMVAGGIAAMLALAWARERSAMALRRA